MRNRNKHLAQTGWIVLSACTFALGWNLKPLSVGGDRRGGESVLAGSGTPSFPAAGLHHTAGGQLKVTDNTRLVHPDARGSKGLRPARIAELGEQLRRATDPITKRALFSELMAGLTAENALEIREQITHLGGDDPDFRDFHYAWGRVAGLEAVLHGMETDESDMGPSLAGWASSDPAAARDWYAALENEGNRGANQQALKAALVHGLAIADPGMAADFVYALGDAGDKRAKEMMGIVMGKVIRSGGAQDAAQWAADLGPGDLRGHALWEATRAGIRDDANATLEWAGDLARDDPNAGSIAYGIAQEMGGRDGPKVAEWLGSLPGDKVTSAYGPLLGGWTKADPLAASEFVAAMPPSESRDHAIGGMVYTHRWEDPAAAAQWATELSSAEGREKVLSLAAEAYIRKDPAGAAEWLPASGLSIEAQQRLVEASSKGK